VDPVGVEGGAAAVAVGGLGVVGALGVGPWALAVRGVRSTKNSATARTAATTTGTRMRAAEDVLK
jgi:hypothetical protein